MIISILFLILGFILLIKGADLFVDGASSTAQNFKISKMVIGLTIIAFGTSAPEFAISISALVSGNTDMVLGNVIGSCIINILLIIGVASVINPINIKTNTIRKELPFCLLISSLLVVLFLDSKINGETLNRITRSDGIIILLFFCVFIYYLISLIRKSRTEIEEKPMFKIGKSLFLVIIGLVGITIGSDLVVDNAALIADKIGISDRIISLTIIALGTSLPELVTTIVSSKKKEQDLLLGNIIGSNIFNICIVLGVPVVLFGTITPASFQMLDLIVLILSSVLIIFFSYTAKKITRLEGCLMIFAFILYYTAIFIM